MGMGFFPSEKVVLESQLKKQCKLEILQDFVSAATLKAKNLNSKYLYSKIEYISLK
jgi:hypothetical protein